MNNPAHKHGADERVAWLAFFTEVRRDELRALLLFFFAAFLMLASYYIIRALREGFILVDFGADARSLAVGVVTLVLMFFIPLYSRLRARFGSNQLVLGVYGFFAITMLAFYGAWMAEWKIGFVFFIWVGLFGLMIISQFWALANGCWSEAAGKRLFPFIMIGANLGALAGTEVAAIASHHHGMHGLMLIGFGVLIAAMVILPFAWRSVPVDEQPLPTRPVQQPRLFGGFSVIAGERYLILIAISVVLLNWINSNGEYLFAHFVELHTETRLSPDASHDEKSEYVTQVYANYMLWYTSIGLILQTFVVARLFRWIGIGRSAIILPAIVAVSYLVLAFIPIFSIVRFLKIAENATDYSLMGTIRHALFLPTSQEAKFDGKTAIDTFFWRLGDLFQAGMVWLGMTWLGWSIFTFALVTAGLSVAFLACNVALAREYRRRVPDDGMNLEGRLAVCPGRPVDINLPAFLTGDPGTDLGTIAAFVDDGTPLPAWLSFDPAEKRMRGMTPEDFSGVLKLRVDGETQDGKTLRYPLALVAQRDH